MARKSTRGIDLASAGIARLLRCGDRRRIQSAPLPLTAPSMRLRARP